MNNMHYEIVIHYVSSDSENSTDESDSLPIEFLTRELAEAAIADIEQHVAFDRYLDSIPWQKHNDQREKMKSKGEVFPWITEKGYEPNRISLNDGSTRQTTYVFWHSSMDFYRHCEILEVKDGVLAGKNSPEYFASILDQ